MQIFSSPVVRRSLFAMLALCLVLEALFSPYDMNADSVSYLDLSDLIHAHQWHWVVNAYWHPGYPALLLLSRMVLGSSLHHELLVARLLNLVITGLLFFAVRFALRAALELRQSLDSGSGRMSSESIRHETLDVAAAGFVLISVMRELSPRSVRPDVLLAALLIFGAAFLMRAGARRDVGSFVGLGICFGLGFLVKSIAFPVFLVAILLLFVVAGSVRSALKGVVIAGLIFAALAGPYIAALTKQKGRFSAGDSGGLNYAWFVDGADRFELQKNDPSRYGLARGELKHTSVQLMTTPPIYFFGDMPGTEPQWLDPSYWNDGLKPRFNLSAQMRETLSGLRIVVQYFVLRPQYALMFGVFALLGGRWRKSDFGRKGVGPVLLLGLAQVGLYLVVYTEPRYIANAVILALCVLLAFVRLPESEFGQEAAAMCAALFLSMVLCTSFTDSLQNMRAEQRAEGRATGAYNRATFTAGESLANAPGIAPGDTVACLGEAACRDDSYWARLAQVKIRTEIFADKDSPLEVWGAADKAATLAVVRSTGAKAIVANFGQDVPTDGWKRLGSGGYFVLYL
jgi:Dolichyl-phosphate-mannose-protein mannosyltransferase